MQMAIDDFLESEVAVAVAATAVALSPRARRLVRRGAVFGVASALKATDVVTERRLGRAGHPVSVRRVATHRHSRRGQRHAPEPRP
jgi:hypothetical protein